MGPQPPLDRSLQILGANRLEAAIVAYLGRHGPARTDELMAGTGLRQPEVSIGVRSLRERGWIVTDVVPREGKGRPMHAYRLDADSDEIAATYLEEGQARLDELQRAMDAVREAFSQARTSRTPSAPARKTVSQRPKNRPHSTTPG